MPDIMEGRSRGAKFFLNVIWNSLGMLTALASGLLLSPYMIRKLGSAGYGVWALSFVLIEYYWLLDLGFRSATVKYVAHYWALHERKKVDEVISTALLYSSVAAAIIVVTITLLASWLQQRFQIDAAYQETFVKLILIVSISWAISIVFGVFGAALEAVQRFDLTNRASIVNTTTRTLGTFLLLYWGYGLIEISLMAAASQVIFFAYQYVSFRGVFKDHHLGPKYANVSMLRQMMGFGVHSFVLNISQQLLTQSAPLLIGHFLPTKFVGFYTLPVKLLQSTVELVARIGLITNANAAEISARGDYQALGGLAIYTNRYSLGLFMPIAIFLATYGDALFLRWVDPEFARYSAPVLPVLLVGSLIAIIGQFSSTMLLQGLAKHQIYSRGLMIEAALGILTMWFVIPRYGLLGAAWVSSTFMVANRCIFISWLTSRVVGRSLMDFMHSVYTAAMLSALPVFGLAWWMQNAFLPGTTWLQLAEAGALIAATYYGIAFFFVLSAVHRRLILQWIVRLAPAPIRA